MDLEIAINRLQQNLSQLRKIAGWTAEDLANLLGVAKQTISNIENNRSQLTQTQYIAIRTILEYQAKINEINNDYILSSVIKILLDDDIDEINEESKENIKKSIDVLAAAKKGGADKTAITGVSAILLGAALGGPIGAITASTATVAALGANKANKNKHMQKQFETNNEKNFDSKKAKKTWLDKIIEKSLKN